MSKAKPSMELYLTKGKLAEVTCCSLSFVVFAACKLCNVRELYEAASLGPALVHLGMVVHAFMTVLSMLLYLRTIGMNMDESKKRTLSQEGAVPQDGRRTSGTTT